MLKSAFCVSLRCLFVLCRAKNPRRLQWNVTALSKWILHCVQNDRPKLKDCQCRDRTGRRQLLLLRFGRWDFRNQLFFLFGEDGFSHGVEQGAGFIKMFLSEVDLGLVEAAGLLFDAWF